MIASIWAESRDRVIGLNGKIPWKYTGDLRRFKRLTIGATVIMGRATFESIGRPLPNRTNIVVTNTVDEFEGCVVERSVEKALARAPKGDVFFIGGARIYEAAMAYVDIIDVTYVPDVVDPPFGAELTMAPKISVVLFREYLHMEHEDDPRLRRAWFARRTLDEVPYDDPSNRRMQELGYMSRRPAP